MFSINLCTFVLRVSYKKYTSPLLYYFHSRQKSKSLGRTGILCIRNNDNWISLLLNALDGLVAVFNITVFWQAIDNVMVVFYRSISVCMTVYWNGVVLCVCDYFHSGTSVLRSCHWVRFGDPNQSPVPTRYESVTGWFEQHRHRAQLTEHAKTPNRWPMFLVGVAKPRHIVEYRVNSPD